MARRSSTIRTPLQDFDLALAQKTLRGPNDEPMRGFTVQGRNAGLPATSEAVHNSAATAFYLPTAADTYRVRAGGDADDATLGIGANTVRLTGIDANLALATDVLTLAGASASGASASFWRVFKAEVVQAGTYQDANAGTIVIESVTGGNAALQIDAGVGVSEAAVFSTPTDRAGFVRNLVIHHEGLSTDPAEIDVFLKRDFDTVGGVTPARQRLRRYGGFTRLENHPLESNWVIPPRSDFYVMAQAGAGTPPLMVTFDVTLAPYYNVD